MGVNGYIRLLFTIFKPGFSANGDILVRIEVFLPDTGATLNFDPT
jgi:hypothetical protein